MEHVLYLQIENDIHFARVYAVKHLHHQVYHVSFEDGYENIFFTDVETGNWIEEDLGETKLAASFGAKINQCEVISYSARKTLSWCKASVADIIVNFGFYTYQQDDNTIFEIYAGNHKFLCNLSRTEQGEWTMSGSCRPMEQQYSRQVQVIISIFEGMADCK